MRAVILSDYAKGALEHVQQFIQKAKAAGVPVTLSWCIAAYAKHV
ncbi:bifunctional heptose 7-phosphate kinase/heptose 1-phosphate adenyltransferase [Vibrio cholerae]|nr:bifunctional heptose 7-phosphate kinase/heptose 1-phosphate adenyltransferase [Vibrio cholerae]